MVKVRTHPETLPKTITSPLIRTFGVIALAMVGFIVWSIFAPLSTTVHTVGNLSALTPSYDIQHPFGGKIDRVLVREHQDVKAGDPLLMLDVKTDRAQLAELSLQIASLTQESNYLERRLMGKSTATNGPQWIVDRFEAMEESVLLQVAASRSNQASLSEQISVLDQRIAKTVARTASMQTRYDDQLALVQKGSFRSSDAALLHESILALEGDLSTTRSQVIGMHEQIRQTTLSVSQAEHQLRTIMLDMLANNQKTLPDLRRKMLDLQSRIAAAVVVAPSDGTVTVLTYDTDQMFAPVGATLLTLTKPTDGYQIAFQVSPQLIDQLSVGMTGQVMVTSLPQRNLPTVHAEITTLSPEARRDPDGNIISYAGTARISPADLKLLLKALDGNMRLSIDMPVAVSFTGRQTTFAQYLVAPFVAFLDRSMQD
ncbi:MAG: HlyD family efflux transporter periplasmic adaptor subunit [Planktomarina sp.]